jgi:hypothetical protein
VLRSERSFFLNKLPATPVNDEHKNKHKNILSKLRKEKAIYHNIIFYENNLGHKAASASHNNSAFRKILL